MRFRSGKGIAAMDDSYISIRIGAVRLRVIMQPVAFDHGGMGAHFGIARNRDRLIALNLNPRAARKGCKKCSSSCGASVKGNSAFATSGMPANIAGTQGRKVQKGGRGSRRGTIGA